MSDHMTTDLATARAQAAALHRGKEGRMARPLTIAELARRWQCSATTVRNQIARGELSCVRLAPRIVRIPWEEIERCEHSYSGATTMPSGQKADTQSDDPFVPKIVMPLNAPSRT